MNIYPVWWDTTITLYNQFKDPQTRVVTWYKHVLDNCFWKYIGEKISVGDVELETNDIICRIPKNDAYLEKYEWEQLPNDRMGDYFTLGQGDIIVKGSVTDTIDEYTSGSRSSDLISKYKKLQGCMEIKQSANNTGAGRCDEHYLARGI